MAEQRIDLASLHEVVFALTDRESVQWTRWQRCAVAEVTMSLLFRRDVFFPAPPGRASASAGSGLVEEALRILDDFVAKSSFDKASREMALKETLDWVRPNHEHVRKQLLLCKQDSSLEPTVRWHVANVWPDHIRRHGSLIDEPLFYEVSAILQWTTKQAGEVRRHARDKAVVKLWSEESQKRGDLPPDEILDGFILATMLRGRYYNNLASQEFPDASLICHHSRNYVLNPVTKLSDLKLVRDHKTHAYLAGLVCAGAMEENSDHERVASWADNIRRIRKRTFQIPRESDDERAIRQAVDIAKQCNIRIKWRRWEAILDKAVHWVVLPVIGIAGGVSVSVSSGSHEMGLIAHSAVESFAWPYVESLKKNVEDAINGRVRLPKLAKSGLERVFAVTASSAVTIARQPEGDSSNSR